MHQAGRVQHVGIELVLHARNAFYAARGVHTALARHNALSRQHNGLQARRTKTVHGEARHTDGTARLQGDLASNVETSGPLRVGATHDHVFYLGGLNTSAGYSVLHCMTTQHGTVGHVECAFPAFR